MHSLTRIPAFFSLILSVYAVQYRPIVLWHGMGDDCCNPDSMGKIRESIETTLPGVYTYSVQLADAEGDDRRAGFFGNVNDQVEKVCEILREDENLRDGFNAIGFSQGGQFLRAVLQRCNQPRMYNLITFGSQHAGVSDIPACLSDDSTCQLMRNIVKRGVYTSWIQRSVVQAQYFKDVTRYDTYLENSVFLPDLNNERPFPDKNAGYARNLASLDRLVLIRFTEDDTVKPRETAWFWFYDEDGELTDVHDHPLYKEDWIGLRQLEESGRVVYQDCVGAHMRFSLEYLEDYVVRPYLSSPYVSSAPAAIESQPTASVSRPQILVDDEGDSSSLGLPAAFLANWSEVGARSRTRFEIMVDEDGDWMVSDGEVDDAERGGLVDETVGDRPRTTVDNDGDWIVVEEWNVQDYGVRIEIEGEDATPGEEDVVYEPLVVDSDAVKAENDGQRSRFGQTMFGVKSRTDQRRRCD